MIISQLEPIKEQVVQDGDEIYTIRSIDDLMRLPSYSDMSDIEIEKLTAYKVAQAKIEAEAEANARINAAFAESLRQQTQTALDNAATAYRAALDSSPTLVTVSPEALGITTDSGTGTGEDQ